MSHLQQFIVLNLIWLPTILVFVGVHFYVIEKQGKTPNHTISFLSALNLCLILTRWIYMREYLFMLLAVLYCGVFYWVLFNLLLNKLRHKPPLYLGSASILDRFESVMKNPGMTLSLKVVIMIMVSFVLIDL